MGRQTLVYPISELLSSAREILRVKGDIPAGWLGVYAGDLPPSSRSGIMIRDVEPGSPADKAGLQRGDLLIQFRGKDIRNSRQFVYLVEGTPVGSKAKLEIIRNGNPMNIEASIEARKPQQRQIELSFNFPSAFGLPASHAIPKPAYPPSNTLIGLETEFLTPPLANALQMSGQTGLLVTDVMKGMPADEAGVRIGDVICSIDGQPIMDPLGFASYLMTRNWNKPIVLKVLREKTEHIITIRIPNSLRSDR